MRRLTGAVVLLACGALAFTGGCSGGMSGLRLQNETQRRQIEKLQSDLTAAQLELSQCQRKLTDLESTGGVDAQALRKRIQALEADVEAKKKLIETMRTKLFAGAPLPVELSTALEDWAKGNDMIEYDAEHGVVKFKSDLLFEPGSDQVAAQASASVKSLAAILNSEQARAFDIIIAGHTDDLPIAKPETRAVHKTNWGLSVHRAISVLNILDTNGIDPKRLSVRGFGEYRPVEANAPNKKGNPKNRRVEIYIVPQGA